MAVLHKGTSMKQSTLLVLTMQTRYSTSKTTVLRFQHLVEVQSAAPTLAQKAAAAGIPGIQVWMVWIH